MSDDPEIGGTRASDPARFTATLSRAWASVRDTFTRFARGGEPAGTGGDDDAVAPEGEGGDGEAAGTMGEAREVAREALERGREGAREKEAELWARYRSLTKERRRSR